MTTSHRIPSGLFLHACRRVEDAMRRDAIEVISRFIRDGDLIATWEDDKVVLLRASTASVEWRRLFNAPRPDASAAARSNAEDLTPFIDLVVGVAQKIYLGGDALHVEFPQEAEEVRAFLSRWENQDVLRYVCRELTGREMVVHLTPAEAAEPGGTRVSPEANVIEHLHVIVGRLRAAGEYLRVSQLERILAGMIARQPPRGPAELLPARISDVLRERLTTPRTNREIVRAEGDLPPSHKSEE